MCDTWGTCPRSWPPVIILPLSSADFYPLTGPEVGRCAICRDQREFISTLLLTFSHHLFFFKQGREWSKIRRSKPPLFSFSRLLFWWRCSTVKWLKRKGASNTGTKKQGSLTWAVNWLVLQRAGKEDRGAAGMTQAARTLKREGTHWLLHGRTEAQKSWKEGKEWNAHVSDT